MSCLQLAGSWSAPSCVLPVHSGKGVKVGVCHIPTMLRVKESIDIDVKGEIRVNVTTPDFREIFGPKIGPKK